MKKKLVLFLTIILVLIGILGTSFYMYKSVVKKPLNSNDSFVEVKANNGTFSQVLADNKDVFKNNVFIKLYNKFNKVSITVNKGVYNFPSDISLKELIDCLQTGKYNNSIIRVTIPEGYTIQKIGETLEAKGVISKKDFILACERYIAPEYIKKSSSKRYDLEGYLFPDTYLFKKDTPGDKIIDVMIKRFEEVVAQIEKENGLKINNLDMDEIITKASVIEREVSRADEKAKVSSVIDNRLNKDMKLQIDATVLYAMGEHKDKLYYSDLKIKSPYNTYYKTGLPVGPISNPGKESIVAALLPEKTDYIYYMTKDGVNHKFFKTYDEFLKYKNS